MRKDRGEKLNFHLRLLSMPPALFFRLKQTINLDRRIRRA